ncbi:branched-chain amino acid ABC transporter substrate-binding protein [Mesorhizobium sp. BAC0120]|uniref:branched-chain amino acid ABC transporter substrate-binding protein n=1 Tax=Mesorhizobium sp. BAC0120 TaxID=3090670 RepID=UPI00298D29DD|nr:branched-chain amino acid ABC transporter substrate-binding protein [Mesorhizobium sp. BAC0120]MDW6021682.1 branched-chain amino acid ABC transporter substrate-binding protein [Mesorhizobium sp. BAC0120]
MKIAVGAPLSGMAAALGREMAQAIEMAVYDANQAGGIDGRRIEVWTLDDGGDEEEGLRAARSFIADHQVLAVVGHYNSNVTLRAAPLYHEAGLPLIAPIVSNPKLTHSGWQNVFRFTNSDDATAAAIAGYMIHQLGKRRAAVVTTATVYGTSMGDEFVRAFERLSGTVLERYKVEEGAKDFADLVGHLPADMDALFYGGTFEGAPLLRAMRSHGLSQLFATGDGCWDISNFLEPTGAAAEQGEGVLVLSACPEIGSVQGTREFAARYERRFGPVCNYAVNAYDSAMTLIAAIRDAATAGGSPPDRLRILNELRTAKRQGIAYPEPISWDQYGDNVASVTALHTVSDGQFRQVALIPGERIGSEMENPML